MNSLPKAEVIIVGDFNARCGNCNYESSEENNNWNNNPLTSKTRCPQVHRRISEDRILNSRENDYSKQLRALTSQSVIATLLEIYVGDTLVTNTTGAASWTMPLYLVM